MKEFTKVCIQGLITTNQEMNNERTTETLKCIKKPSKKIRKFTSPPWTKVVLLLSRAHNNDKINSPLNDTNT